MIRFLKALVLLPVAILVIWLSVANREPVRVSLDPVSPEPVLSANLPLFLVVFAAVAVGILVGGVGAWLGQGTTRRRARERGRHINRLERETDLLRRESGPSDERAAYGGQRAALPAPR